MSVLDAFLLSEMVEPAYSIVIAYVYCLRISDYCATVKTYTVLYQCILGFLYVVSSW